MNKKNYFLIGLTLLALLVSVYFNVVQAEKLKIVAGKNDLLHADFVQAISMISLGINEAQPPDVVSIEHAYKMYALSEYTSYDKQVINQYTRILPGILRDMNYFKKPIRHATEIKEQLRLLANNPVKQEAINELIRLVKLDEGAS
ncbi:hypothetical protein NQ117_07055 [Paenibacillus sp. SC116]|uniref:hypothetical protein n=1 Tax=Paenibacillus sp. SC116 TaxID=2968986 RepID=UPI00215AB4BF|nr:hypothetical protein [Paenibacillus sp. SC116]MCR8843437.1 hypothetical protein [Paenibacillus sp. SC116]